MTITVIGTGFVGVVSAGVYASFGHTVYGLDIDQHKVDLLNESKVPFYEPGLEELLVEQQQDKRLHFTTNYEEAISHSDIILIAVGTPSAPDGQADLKFVHAASKSLAPHLKPGAIVVVKSTVPPGTLETVKATIDPLATVSYHLASVPEFLREGTAVSDTLHPDRVVIGATEDIVFETLAELHKPLNAPVLRLTPESAQMAKYSANAYLAVRITFANQIADLCEKNGANIQEVLEAIGYDNRIGQHYWYPGFGYGGSCFPKDVKELAAYSRAIGEGNNLFNKVSELNEHRIERMMETYGKTVGGWQDKTVAVLGLSFKPNTDDMREAPSIKIIDHLVKSGATVRGFDPKALSVAKHFIPEHHSITYHSSVEAACKNADVIMAVVEWPEVVGFDFSSVREPKEQWFIDGRNQCTPQRIKDFGYNYLGVGRS